MDTTFLILRIIIGTVISFAGISYLRFLAKSQRTLLIFKGSKASNKIGLFDYLLGLGALIGGLLIIFGVVP